MDRDAIERGRRYERELAARFGATLQPNSGATPWAKLDLGRRKLLLSAKWTGGKTFSVTRALVDEIRRPIVGPGGLGPDWTGALVTRVGGVDYAVMALDDLVGLLSEDARPLPPDANDERRARSRRTLLDID